MSEPENTTVELPEELWAIQFTGNDLGTFALSDDDSAGNPPLVYATEARAAETIASSLNSVGHQYKPVLVGVHPRHRDEARSLRGFIESIANGKSRPSMGDARRFLAELDASKNGKERD